MANKIGKLMVWKLNFMTSCDIISDTTCNRSIVMMAELSCDWVIMNMAEQHGTDEVRPTN